MKISKRDSLTNAYVEGLNPPARGVQEFCFDHSRQMKVTPKAAPRGGTFGNRTMNSSGMAAGPKIPKEGI